MPLNSITRRGTLVAGSAGLLFACSGRPESTAETGPEMPLWRAGPALPLAVQEIYPALHQGKIHLAGGFISNGETISGATDRHLVLDPLQGDWTDAAPLPVARHHPNLISFQNRLLAIGGFEARSADAVWVMQAGVWEFDGESWSDAPSLPQPNGESVLGVLDDALHACGGRKPTDTSNANWNDHSDIADHFVLTGLDNAWETAAPLPTARNSAAAAAIGSNWHVIGGRTVTGGNTPAHEVYDAGEDRWRTAAPMPQGQGGLAAASVGGKLYAFGGEFFDNGGGVYPEAWAYDPARDTWDAIPDMPQPRHGLGAVAVEDEIYLIGGALKVGGNMTSNLVEIFTPTT
ncbi:MAG: kelch repeat-containing protein [Pseudomonadota bacterium]